MPWCVSNFEAMARIIGARSPDLVVNAGDIAFNGADVEDDLAYARACHAALDAAVRAVPGNHDVGDNPWGLGVEQPITDTRLERYRRHFGDDFWSVDVASWHFVGANAQLFGSGLAVEEAQWSCLASGGRHGQRPAGGAVRAQAAVQRASGRDRRQPAVRHAGQSPSPRRCAGER
jgi:3',5'-cyclic AMP phosphodiesterase CpdA